MNKIKYIADSTIFMQENSINIPYDCMITTPSVEQEMKSKFAILKMNIAKIKGLRIENSDPK